MGVITIIGAGMMGSALCFPASYNGHEVRLVGTPLDEEIIHYAKETGEHLTLNRKLPSTVKFYQFEQVERALENADFLISGVSSFGLDWFSDSVIPIINDALPILSVTKGMIFSKEGRLITYPEYYAEQHPSRKLSICAVGGPCTSYELADHDQTHVCFCGDDEELLKKLKSFMNTEYYHISTSVDVIGLECAVAIKNAYALGVSLAVGISEKKEGIGGKEHYNSQAALFQQSIKEMQRIIKSTGGHEHNISWAAGDLYVTIFGGRTRKIGVLLGRGLSFKEAMKQLSDITLESIVIIRRIAKFIRLQIENEMIDAKDFPLLLHVDQIINEEKDVAIPWEAFTENLV